MQVFYITKDQVEKGSVAMGLQDIVHGLRGMIPDLAQELGGDEVMSRIVGYKRVSLQPCMDIVSPNLQYSTVMLNHGSVFMRFCSGCRL